MSTLTVMVLLLELALTTAVEAWSRMPPPPLPPGTEVSVEWRGKPVFLPHPPQPPR